MKKFDWKTRFRNKSFLLLLFAAVLAAAREIANVFGYDLTLISEQATNIFNAVLTLLVVLGVVVDPLTKGITDKTEEGE